MGYSLVALDLQDPRIAEGWRLTAELLGQLPARVESTGADLLLLLIPTKESVFSDASRSQATLTAAHGRLALSEEACRMALLRSAEQAAVQVVDLFGPLKAAVAQGRQVYPTNIESHPNPEGYDLIARTIAARIDTTCGLSASDVVRPGEQATPSRRWLNRTARVPASQRWAKAKPLRVSLGLPSRRRVARHQS
jgi:hypothetical protein